MRAGRLRHRVTLQQRVDDRNAIGESVPAWYPFAEVWAAIEPLNGKEFFTARGENSTVTHRLRMRYLAGVTPAMRVLNGARVFDIDSVIDPADRHAELVLMCTEVVT